MNRFKQKYVSLTSKEKQAFWLSLALTVGMVGFSFVSVPQLPQASNWLTQVVDLMPVFVAIICLTASALIFNGYAVWGGYLFVVGNTISNILSPMAIGNIGFLMGVLYFVVCLYIANLVFPAKVMRWYPYLNGLIAMFAVLLDVYWPYPRVTPPAETLWIVQGISGLILVTYLGSLLRNFQNFSLRSKLITTSLVLSILPMSVVGFLANQSSQVALTQDADDSLTIAADQVAASVDLFISSNMELMRTEAQDPDYAVYLKMSPQERAGSEMELDIYTTAKARASRSRFITSYALLDQQGIDIIDTDSREIGQNKSDRSYFQEVLKTGKPYVSPFGYSSIGNEPSIFFSAPVKDELNQIIGVVRVRYHAGFVQDLVTQLGDFQPGGLFGMIVTENNILLADSRSPDYIYKSIVPLDAAQLQEMKSGRYIPENTTLEQSYVDISALALGIRDLQTTPNFSGDLHPSGQAESGTVERSGATRLKNVAWYMVVGQSEASLYEPVVRQARSTLLVGVIAAVVAIGFALLIAWFLARPLSGLAAAATQLAQGNLGARAQRTTSDEVGALADTFNTMAEQLAGLVGSLEQRVADRTKALSTSAEVSRRLSTILSTRELVKEVVEELQRSFTYYHVHIYLFDEHGQNLVMTGGTGEAGRVMLARGHKIPRGRGLVGRAADRLSAVLVRDVTQSTGWLPNPLLPNTKAEVAVPIAVGQNVLGVLDVQQDQVDGLQQEDADLLQSIANQVAIALQNARRYEDAQRQASREALIAAIGQRIQTTDSVEEALQVAVREVGRALNTEGVYVQLGAHENGQKQRREGEL